MSKPVLIVESASKEASIHDQWNEELITLIVDSIPIKVSPQPDSKDKTKVEFSFTPFPSSQKFIDDLLSLLDRDIYLAFDNNERGEYWSWMISEFINTKTEGKNKLKRLRLTELTRDNIQRNLKSPDNIQYGKALACQVRTIFDHFLIKHIERLIGTKIGIQGLPLDLATIIIIFFLTEREDEIKNFSPANKWQITARVTAPNGNITAKLKIAHGITENGLIKNKEDVHSILSMLKQNTFSVKSISQTPRTFYPPKPFNTLDLIQEAYLLLGMDTEKTLESIKQLFYGAKINGQHKGLISFYSTLENDLPENLAASLRQSVVKIKGESALGHGHDPISSDQIPIIPLIPDLSPEEAGRFFPKEGADLYELIRARALASQMIPAEGEKIEVTFQEDGGCTFTAEADVIKVKGYMEVYQGTLEKNLLTPSPLVDLKEGLKFKSTKVIPQQTSGIAPEYYTMETLFSDMAEMGFDMNDNAITILKNMLQKGYLEISEEGNLRPLENSTKITTGLDRAFPKMSGLNLIAYIVQTMDEAISGRKDLMWSIEQFNQTLTMHGRVLVKSKAPEAPEEVAPQTPAPTVIARPDETGVEEEPLEEPLEEKEAVAEEPQKCPECGSELNLKFGRFGPFYGCSAFPECRFTKKAEDAKDRIEAEKRTCAECGMAMQLKRGRFGLFWACTGYPQCRHTEPYEEKQTLDMDCPVCTMGKVLSRRSKIGKRFYVCSDKECEFIAWSQPYAIPCPACGHPFLTEKKNAKGIISLNCPKSGCKHQQSLPEELAQKIAKKESSKASTTKKRKAGTTKKRKAGTTKKRKAGTTKKGVRTRSKKKSPKRSSKKAK